MSANPFLDSDFIWAAEMVVSEARLESYFDYSVQLLIREAYLIHGPVGEGKEKLARTLAKKAREAMATDGFKTWSDLREEKPLDQVKRSGILVERVYTYILNSWVLYRDVHGSNTESLNKTS